MEVEKRYIAGVLGAIVLLLIFFRNTQWTDVLRALGQVDMTALLMANGSNFADLCRGSRYPSGLTAVIRRHGLFRCALELHRIQLLACASRLWFFYSGSDITFLLAFLVVGAAIPTPASAGGFHALGQFALEVFFNVEHSATIAPITVIHAIAFFPLTFLGIYYLFQEGLWNRELKRSAVEKLRSTGPFR